MILSYCNHPSIVSIILSVIFYFIRNKNIFYKISLLIITILYTCNFIQIGKIVENHVFLELCIIMVLVFAHSYALYKKRIKEFIFGSLYASASFFVLEAKDYISIFIGLEFMMIFATIIIYLGNQKNSIEESKNYFITHFISGSLFLIGVIHLKQQDLITDQIDKLSSLLTVNQKNIGAWFILTSLLINVGSFPFGGWVKNSYSNSDKSGFLYLIFFTSKICLLILSYLFPATNILIICGLSSLFYGLYRLINEENSINNLCYLANIYISFALIFLGSKAFDQYLFTAYIIAHYLYKLPLCLFVISFEDITNGKLISDIKAYCSQNRYALIYLVVILMFIIGVNGTLNFYIKNIAAYNYKASQTFDYTLLYYILSCILFIKIFYQKQKKVELYRDIQYKKFYIIMLCMSCILCFILGIAATLHNMNCMMIYFNESNKNGFYYFHLQPLIKNILSLILGFYISTKITLKQNHNRALNLVDYLVNILYMISKMKFPRLLINKKYHISSNHTVPSINQGAAIILLLLVFFLIIYYFLWSTLTTVTYMSGFM